MVFQVFLCLVSENRVNACRGVGQFHVRVNSICVSYVYVPHCRCCRSTLFYMAFACCVNICGECAHGQHVRRTLTLTLTHTITACSVSENDVRVRILTLPLDKSRVEKEFIAVVLLFFVI